MAMANTPTRPTAIITREARTHPCKRNGRGCSLTESSFSNTGGGTIAKGPPECKGKKMKSLSIRPLAAKHFHGGTSQVHVVVLFRPIKAQVAARQVRRQAAAR